jgi:hypothetical protein
MPQAVKTNAWRKSPIKLGFGPGMDTRRGSRNCLCKRGIVK